MEKHILDWTLIKLCRQNDLNETFEDVLSNSKTFSDHGRLFETGQDKERCFQHEDSKFRHHDNNVESKERVDITLLVHSAGVVVESVIVCEWGS